MLRKELLNKFKKDNRAYDLLQGNGLNPIGVYGKYVIANGEPYPSFTIAADMLLPDWDKKGDDE